MDRLRDQVTNAVIRQAQARERLQIDTIITQAKIESLTR